MARTTRILLALAAACAVAFALVAFCAYETSGGRWLDRVGLEGFIAMQTSTMHELTHTAVQLGGPAQVGSIGLALAAVALAVGRPRAAAAVIVLLAGTSISSQLLKDLLSHPRLQPVIEGGHVGAASLPSGHATAAMALALAAVIAAPRRARPAAAVVGAAVALAVGFSVVTLGWHFPSDVLAGYLLATGWALILVAGLRVLERRFPIRHSGGLGAAAKQISERGLRVAAAGLTVVAAVAALLFTATHAPEIAEFGRDRTASVAIAIGMAFTAVAFPVAMAAALRRS